MEQINPYNEAEEKAKNSKNKAFSNTYRSENAFFLRLFAPTLL